MRIFVYVFFIIFEGVRLSEVIYTIDYKYYIYYYIIFIIYLFISFVAVSR